MDWVDDKKGRSLEVQFCAALRPEHRLQAAAYAAMLALQRRERCSCELFNARDASALVCSVALEDALPLLENLGRRYAAFERQGPSLIVADQYRRRPAHALRTEGTLFSASLAGTFTINRLCGVGARAQQESHVFDRFGGMDVRAVRVVRRAA